MSGILSSGAKVSYKATPQAASYTELTDVISISELGGGNEKIDVTTLASANKRYINGLDDYSDITITFLYSNAVGSAFRLLSTLGDHTSVPWEISLPDNTKFTFTGEVSLKLSAVEVNNALTFEATIAIDSDVTVTNPA